MLYRSNQLSLLTEKDPPGGAGERFAALPSRLDLANHGVNSAVLCTQLLSGDASAPAFALVHDNRIYHILLTHDGNDATWSVKSCCAVLRDRRVSALAASPFVREECAVLTDANEIIVDPWAVTASGQEAAAGRPAGFQGYRQLSEVPSSESFCYTEHPRTFMLCRGKTLQRVDLREPHNCEEVACRLAGEDLCEYCDKLTCLEEFMLVKRPQGGLFNSFCIVACATRHVRFYDVRMMARAALTHFAHNSTVDPIDMEFIEDRMFLWSPRYADIQCFRLGKRNMFEGATVQPKRKSYVDAGLVEHPLFATPVPRKSCGVNATWLLEKPNFGRAVLDCAPLSASRIAVLASDSEVFVDEYI